MLFQVYHVSTETGFVDVIVRHKRHHFVTDHFQAGRSVHIVQDRPRLHADAPSNYRADHNFGVGDLPRNRGNQLLNSGGDCLWILL